MTDPSAGPQALTETLVSGDTIAAPASFGDAETLAAAPPGPAAAEVSPGGRLGRYFVIRRLGAGAMGVVFAAYDPKLDRKVALKLLESAGSDEARTRLEREAQALAKLAHPNVVAVYDVDVHDGRLFVAMELVAGRTLGDWMKEGGPWPWSTVLPVFIAAGRGLAAAHAAGLVHRDFKPDNVMLGDDGRARVMDFGLARPGGRLPAPEDLRTHIVRQLGPQALATTVTRTGAMMGTPAYMPPEQFEGRADARSDQFSFCVALYEALYGQRPFAGATLVQLVGAVASGALEPEPPGSRVPAWLRAVVLRGLAADPERRWPSMAALLGALADDPAQRRRRRWSIAAALALVAGLGGAAAWAVERQAEACAGFEGRLAGVWDAEQKAAVRRAIEGTRLSYAAGTWERVEQRLDEYTRRWVDARRDACEATQRGEQSGELLDLRMRCLDARLQEVTAMVEVLAEADVGVVRKAVEAVAGLPTLTRCADALALTAAIPPPEDPAVAERVAAIDRQLVEATALRRAGRYEQGLARAQEAVAAAEGLDYAPLQARAWLVEGSLADRAGAYERAEAALERAYEAAVGLTMTAEAADAARLLVYVVSDRLARFPEARRWVKDARPLARAAGGVEARAGYLEAVGVLATREGHYQEARAHLEEALALKVDTLGASHPHVALTLSSLGAVAGAEGKYEAATAYLERALTVLEASLGPAHPDVAVVLNNLGGVAAQRGANAEARAHLERAVIVLEAALGPDHPSLAGPLDNLGSVLHLEGAVDEARARHGRALTILERAWGDAHPDLAAPLTNLGDLELSQGRLAEARASFERALSLLEEALGPEHPSVAYPRTGLGEALLGLGDPEAARGHLERALALRSAGEGDPTELAHTRFVLARALWGAGAEEDRARARELASLAAAAYEAAGDESARELAEVRAWLSARAP